MSSDAPIIGITGGRIHAARVRGIHPVLLDATIEAYFDDYGHAVARAGGIPVYLSPTGPAAIVERLDGVILAGGEDIDPRLYGRRPARGVGPHDPRRDAFELEVIAEAFRSDLPVLGVCRGLQLLNVACGGTLIADIETCDEYETHIPIYPAATRTQTVTLAAGSLAARVFGDRLEINSFHHQAVDEPGRGIAVVGRSGDGVVEAIELPGRDVLGVQWHPELYRAPDPAFDWIVGAAAARRPGARPTPEETPIAAEVGSVR